MHKFNENTAALVEDSTSSDMTFPANRTLSSNDASGPNSAKVSRENSMLLRESQEPNFNHLSRTARVRSIATRKDPEREFFEMTVLAYQLRNVKKSTSIMRIDRSALYFECLKIKKGFEYWPEWIEQTVTRILISEQYKKSKAKGG